MSRICTEIREWVEEEVKKPVQKHREERRKKCKKKKCKKWCLCCNKWVCWIETVVYYVVEWIIEIVGKWVVTIVCEVISILLDGLQVLGRVLLSIGSRIITFPEYLFCRFGKGKRVGKKKIRLTVFVVTDENGIPAVPLNDIDTDINAAKGIYAKCNIELLVEGPLKLDKPHLLEGHECGGFAWFTDKRDEYDAIAGRQPGEGVAAFYINDIPGDSVGCHIQTTRYFLVASDKARDTLAHEMGHACGLEVLGHEDDPDNLMAPGSVRTGSNLTKSQCCKVRTSWYARWL